MTRNQFISSLPKNLFAGFVVSLIALPLGLSLAVASGMPATAGIVSAVVGGVVVALLGGSYVTISGPGYSLVVVLLTAVTTLGGGDLFLGYTHTLAAITIAGVLITLLGVLRMGKLAEFFPASAIEGMLAAIGLSLLVKQFPIMLGLEAGSGNPLIKLFKLPLVVTEFVQSAPESASTLAAGLLGIVSLVILLFNSSIRNRYYQQIPSPMWVILLAVGYSYYCQLRGIESPIRPDLFIQLPDSVESMIYHPNFDLINSWGLWSVAITIAVIGSVESLLSIKAVDNLDPQRRRSNANKDLRALGVATAISGFLGGLNVVTVISRSSVNVTQQANNRSSNFFHGVFLLLFILFFSKLLNRVPLSALAAILVYTGYKLAHPLKLVAAAKVGKEQLLILVATSLITLSTNIITGIFLGTLITLLSHFVITKRPLLFLLHLFQPNVLAFKEKDTDSYYVSVKYFCSFLNLFKLKSKLDAIGATKTVVIDFSLCEFVDHSAMQTVENYIASFEKKGGTVSTIGLDLHGASSSHPFAVRNLATENTLGSIEKLFSRRQENLSKMSKEYGWEYCAKNQPIDPSLCQFLFFETKPIVQVYNTLIDPVSNGVVQDIVFNEGEFIARESARVTALTIKLESSIPSFVLDKEGLLDRLNAIAGFGDLTVEGHNYFNRKFHLSGSQPDKIRGLFNKELIFLIESRPIYLIESSGSELLILKKDRLLSPTEVKALVYFGRELIETLACNSISSNREISN